MTSRDHTHLERVYCQQGRSCPRRNAPDMYVPMGPITGLSGVAAELMRHLGHEPRDHQDVLLELEQAIGEETLDLGRAILAEHGLRVAEDAA